MKDALGHGSDAGAHSAGIKALPPKMSAEAFQALVAKSKEDSERADRITAEVRTNRGGTFEHGSGKMMLVSPSFEGDGLRATSFDKDGEAQGHREYPSYDQQGLRSEVSMALSGGFQYKGDKL
jgi:hypothetical protein